VSLDIPAEPYEPHDFVNEPRNLLELRFAQFHLANPGIYDTVLKYTLQARARGYRNFGIKAIWEVIRWECGTPNNPTDEFKVNNNHCPYYARLVMRNHPELKGFFRVRGTASEKEEE